MYTVACVVSDRNVVILYIYLHVQADKQSPTTVGEPRTKQQSLASHERIREATPSMQKSLSTDTGLYPDASPLLQLGFDAFRYVCMYKDGA